MGINEHAQKDLSNSNILPNILDTLTYLLHIYQARTQFRVNKYSRYMERNEVPIQLNAKSNRINRNKSDREIKRRRRRRENLNRCEKRKKKKSISAMKQFERTRRIRGKERETEKFKRNRERESEILVGFHLYASS